MESPSLRAFLVYFKGGRCVNLRATKFEIEREYNNLKGFSFLTETGEKGAIYLDPESVAAILPAYNTQADEEYKGAFFKVSLKGEDADAITVRADTFTIGASNSIWFYDAEGRPISDVWVATSEVLACVPSEGLPSAFKFPSKDSASA